MITQQVEQAAHKIRTISTQQVGEEAYNKSKINNFFGKKHKPYY